MTEEENNQVEADENASPVVAEQGQQPEESESTEAVQPEEQVQVAENSSQLAADAGESEEGDLNLGGLTALAGAQVEEKPVEKPASKKAEEKSEASGSEKEKASEEEEEEEKEAPILKELSEEQAKLPWYVVHTYSGFEHMVKASLEDRMVANNLSERFGNVLIPQETVVELVRGQKKTSTRKFLPGYIVVQMDLDDETWHFVCETPKVTGFVGDSRNPVPLSKGEVDNLVKQMEGGSKKAKPKVSFEEGDAVKVIDGPFADFNGTVDDVKPDKGKLRVLISIFGRNTPVELDFVQVEKA